MSDKNLTVRDLLNGRDGNFNPLDIDTSEIKELSEAMPKDGNIDINNAEVLATKYLRGADICSELLAIATSYVSKADTEKKKAYSYAALIKASTQNIKTDKSRSWFAEMDEDYIGACNKYSEALAFAKWISSKYDSFNKMHYLCKHILKRAYPHEQASSWNGTLDEESHQPKPKTDESW